MNTNNLSNLAANERYAVEFFTVPGRNGSQCADISGVRYANLGYYTGSGVFESGDGFISPNGGLADSNNVLKKMVRNISGLTVSYVGRFCGSVGGVDDPDPPSPPPPPPPPPPPGEGDVGGVGGEGDIHFFTGGSDSVESLIFRDENYMPGGDSSHWAIDWIEINKQNQVSAWLARRSSSSLFENTSVVTSYVKIGNPIGVSLSYQIGKPMSSFQANPNLPNDNLKYVGGILIEFFRQTAREGPVLGSRANQIGRGQSFMPDNRFRLYSGTSDLSPMVISQNRRSSSPNAQSLGIEFQKYVYSLTGSSGILLDENSDISPLLSVADFSRIAITGDFANTFGAAPNPTSPGYYPMLLNKTQQSGLLKSYSSIMSSGAEMFQQNPQVKDIFAQERSEAIRSQLAPKVFECKQCVDERFQPVADFLVSGCVDFMASLNVEMENSGGAQLGPAVDCRCCRPAAENEYWDDRAFCGREKSKCLPLGVLYNGNFSGFTGYGFDYPVHPFFTNIDDDMGKINKRVQLTELPYVVNGSILSGKFHSLSGNYPVNQNIATYYLLQPLVVSVSGSAFRRYIIGNNAYSGNMPLSSVKVYT